MAASRTLRTLSNGTKVPRVGLGTWKSKPGEVKEAVKIAIDEGYRLLDCAFGYRNEPEVGAALQEKIKDGVVKREDVFITTKLWNTYHHPDDVRRCLDTSLKNLQVDYVDLYLIHWPHAFKRGSEFFPQNEKGEVLYDDIDPLDTWKVMEECVRAGVVKAIGLSNFNSHQIQRIIDNSDIKPVMLQVEINPFFSNEKLIKFCHERDIAVTAYSPLASADRPGATADDPKLVDEPKLKVVADKYGKTPAQVVLRWLLQKDLFIIPKSVNPGRIKENYQLFDFELSKEDMAEMDGFNTNVRVIGPYVMVDGKQVFRDRNAPHFPFHVEF